MALSRRLLIALTSALMAVPATAQAANYYVSPAGSDSNSGLSPSSAWRTIAKADGHRLSAGDAVLFQGRQAFTGELDPNGSGSQGRPISYGSYGAGRATLVPAPGGINAWLESQHDIAITNLNFDGAGQGTCIASAAGGTGVTNIRLDSIEVHNCGSGALDGIGIHQSNTSDGGWIVRNSYVHNTTDSGIILEGEAGPDVIVGTTLDFVGTASGAHGFNAHGIYSKNPGVVIVNNDIGHYGTEGVSTRFRNALIQGNYIHDGLGLGGGSDGVGFYSYDPTGAGTSIIRFNRFNGAGANAVYVSGYPDSGAPQNQPENWLIYNNTVVGSTGSPIYFDSRWNGTELAIQNNVFVGGTGLHIGRAPARYIENHNDGPNMGAFGDTAVGPGLSGAPAFAPQVGSAVAHAGTTDVPGTSWTRSCNGAALDYCGTAPTIGAVEPVAKATVAQLVVPLHPHAVKHPARRHRRHPARRHARKHSARPHAKRHPARPHARKHRAGSRAHKHPARRPAR